MHAHTAAQTQQLTQQQHQNTLQHLTMQPVLAAAMSGGHVQAAAGLMHQARVWHRP